MTLHITGAVCDGNWCLSESNNPFQLLRDTDCDAYQMLESYILPIAKGNHFGEIHKHFGELMKINDFLKIPRDRRYQSYESYVRTRFAHTGYDLCGIFLQTSDFNMLHRSRYNDGKPDVCLDFGCETDQLTGTYEWINHKMGHKGTKERYKKALLLNNITPKKGWSAKRMYQELRKLE